MALPNDGLDAPASHNATKSIVYEAEQEIHGTEHIELNSELSINPSNSMGTGVDDLISRALRFLSTASNEMLGGIALGLAASTYLILGRIGLLLIGALVGIILHASWEGWNTSLSGPEDARKEKGLDVVKRILDWREKNAVNLDNGDLDDTGDSTLAIGGFEDFQPETRKALSAFVDAVILDYVKWWYGPIVPADESFPTACHQTLTSFIRSISVHLSRKRPADTFLHFLTHSSSIIIVFLNELSQALSASQVLKGTPAEAVDEYLLTNPKSHLANILNESEQKKKFKIIAEDILENFLDRSAYQCNPMKVFLREILANVVLETSLTTCSKPEWINGWIVYLLEEGEPEIIQALDVGIASTPSDRPDSNYENVSSVKVGQIENGKHRKRLSKAEEAMEEAMEEAKRLSRLIAEDDRRRVQIQDISDADLRIANPDHETLSNAPPLRQAHQSLSNNESKTESQNEVTPNKLTPVTRSTATGAVFTSFDQIAPPAHTALQGDSYATVKSSPSVLHNANIIIDDDSTPNEKGRIRAKPTGDYLIQIEPKILPGWLTVRKLQDFENLHETLRRIAHISGVTAFTEQHSSLPDWKIHTKASLRGELERYLRDACWHQLLADSDGMRRFLEKDQGNMSTSGNKGVGWSTPAAIETMGKGVLDVLVSAPKGATEGGKAVFGGVTGVLGNIGSLGQRKREGTASFGNQNTTGISTTAFSSQDSTNSVVGSRWGMDSEESLRSSPSVQSQPGPVVPMERKLSYASMSNSGTDNEALAKGRVSVSSRSSTSDRINTSNGRDPSQAPPLATIAASPSHILDVESITLPPPPSDIPDDYNTEPFSNHSRTDSIAPTARTSISTVPSLQSPSRASLSTPGRPVAPKRPLKEALPLTEEETRVAVELLFATINELYTLSSAWNIWNIRRALLNAAKTFLLRPGNPSLASIQSLIQDSFITANTTDTSIAAQISKLRENTMPTEDERKSWPQELTLDEKDKLRFKARKLLVERGMPAALTSVMGQVATGEALGRVFDCLQIEDVARGLMFGLLLQGVRAMTH